MKSLCVSLCVSLAQLFRSLLSFARAHAKTNTRTYRTHTRAQQHTGYNVRAAGIRHGVDGRHGAVRSKTDGSAVAAVDGAYSGGGIDSARGHRRHCRSNRRVSAAGFGVCDDDGGGGGGLTPARHDRPSARVRILHAPCSRRPSVAAHRPRAPSPLTTPTFRHAFGYFVSTRPKHTPKRLRAAAVYSVVWWVVGETTERE